MDTSEPPSVTGETSARGELGRIDGGQLAAISNAMVGLHRRYYGRGATKSKAYQVNDDLILVELRDAYLTVERTLIERGQANTVRQTRLTFQQAMFDEFLDAIEQVTGRKVSEYVTESITDLGVILEIFYLEPVDAVKSRLEREAREDTGELQRPIGGISAEDK